MRGAFGLAIGVTLAAGPAAAQPILGGSSVQVGDYPTVVAVELGTSALCTGTLIHPRWVLTAAHCVEPEVVGVNTQEQVTAITRVRLDATEAFTAGRLIAAARTIPHPDFSLDALGDNDIGLIELADPVDDRMVSRVNRSAAAAPVGVSVTLVGYGRDETGEPGTLLQLGNHMSMSCASFGGNDATLLCYDQTDGRGQCQGDSGGPSFVTIDGIETVTGITSFGDQDCVFFGAQSRVDAEVGFADLHIGQSLGCVHDGACGFGCAGLNHDEDCPSCAGDGDCADGQACDSGGTCVPAPLTPGGLGSPCVASTECAAGLCLDDGAQQLCSQDCRDDDDCGDDFDCLPTDTELGVCWPGAGDDGGCAASGGQGTMLALVGLVLVVRRRSRGRAARASRRRA